MSFLKIVWEELHSVIEDSMDTNPNQLLQDVEFKMNNKFNRYITSLEAHAVQGKDLVTYCKQLNGLKWLDDYSLNQAAGDNLHSEGPNMVQEKIE
jgi:hypothetical protein